PGNNQRRHVPSLDCLTRLHGISVLEINEGEACRTRTSSRGGSHDKEQLVRSTDHEQVGAEREEPGRGRDVRHRLPEQDVRVVAARRSAEAGRIYRDILPLWRAPW